MLAGEVYSAIDPQLLEELNRGKQWVQQYNALPATDMVAKRQMLKMMLGHVADDEIIINQPFYCDYGRQISVGKRFFANFNFTVLDEAPVTIGDNVTIGAGSVVVSDIPSGVIAVGNPCHVIKTI